MLERANKEENTEEFTKFCANAEMTNELSRLAEKYRRTECDILMMGFGLLKLIDQFDNTNRHLAIVENGNVLKKIILD